MIFNIKSEWILLSTNIQTHFFQLLGVLAMLFAPISGILMTIAICITADTIIGIWKARKLKQPITSRKLSQIISKLLLYEGALLLFYLIDVYMLGDILIQFFSIPYLLTKVVGLILVSVEIFSIDENYRAVKQYGLWHAFKRLVGRAKEIKDEIEEFDLNKF